MGKISDSMGKICDNCPLCNHARNDPDTAFGKVMDWHGKWCPAWRAQKNIKEEKNKAKHD